MAQIFVQLIEDDEDITELIHYNLTQEGWDVLCAASAEAGFQNILNLRPDILLVDIMLPGESGIALCKKIRLHPTLKELPIVIISARSEDNDIVEGLDVGADDYVPKPFSPKILIARINAVLRRQASNLDEGQPQLMIKELIIDPNTRMVRCQKKQLKLTHSEFEILYLLVSKPGWVYARSHIVNTLNGENHAITDRAVDVHIVSLRKKLGPYGAAIETIRSIGYRFNDSVLL